MTNTSVYLSSKGPTGPTGATGPQGNFSPWIIKTGAYTAANLDRILADTSAGAFSITLPATPAAGTTVTIGDYASTWGTNNLTVLRNGVNIQGQALDLTCDSSGADFSLVYTNASQGWQIIAALGQPGPTGPTGPGSIISNASGYLSNGNNNAISPNAVWSAAGFVQLTYAATIAFDMSVAVNAYVTLTGNATLGSPANPKPGQCGTIRIVQDATGSRTLAFSTGWLFSGGTKPSLSTAAGAIDYLDYMVYSGTEIRAALTKAWA